MERNFNPALQMLRMQSLAARLAMEEEERSRKHCRIWKEGYQTYRQDWAGLLRDFQSVPPPLECRVLADTYFVALSNYVNLMTQIEQAMETQGPQHADEYARHGTGAGRPEMLLNRMWNWRGSVSNTASVRISASALPCQRRCLHSKAMELYHPQLMPYLESLVPERPGGDAGDGGLCPADELSDCGSCGGAVSVSADARQRGAARV